jgi:hypothetical protein
MPAGISHEAGSIGTGLVGLLLGGPGGNGWALDSSGNNKRITMMASIAIIGGIVSWLAVGFMSFFSCFCLLTNHYALGGEHCFAFVNSNQVQAFRQLAHVYRVYTLF